VASSKILPGACKDPQAAGERTSKQASERASKQAIKRPRRTRATSAECDPNHSLRGKAFRGGLQADRGARCFYTTLYI